MSSSATSPRDAVRTAADLPPAPPAAAYIVILAGVCAAVHMGKLPPAITALQAALGMSLLQAGFLLSLIQLAGMTVGVALGAVADGLGLRRSMLAGLAVLSLASVLGGFATSVPALMALRACEGFGFLLVVLPAPGLLRRLVPAQRLNKVLGLWGAYMPLATASALLVGPLWIEALGWSAWWWGLAGLSALMALGLARAVPAAAAASRAAPGASLRWTTRLRQTLSAPAPWWVALTFSVYSAQWLAVVGFLPAIYTQAGVSGGSTAVLTAAVAGVNMIGNMASGRLLHRGVAPTRLLAVGFVVMGLSTAAAFAGDASAGLPPLARYAALLAFSAVGGLIPGTLFALAVRAAPGDHLLSTTIGWMQQWSAFGQFAGPPLVAWVTSRAGGWHWTWLVTGACACAGLGLTAVIGRWLAAEAALENR
jgi:CP family cyanate transporter-like MFS transporter